MYTPPILECGGTQKIKPDQIQSQYTTKKMKMMKDREWERKKRRAREEQEKKAS